MASTFSVELTRFKGTVLSVDEVTCIQAMDSTRRQPSETVPRGFTATLDPYQLRAVERWRTLGTLIPSMIHSLTNPNGLIVFNADLLKRLCPDIDLVLEEHAALNRDFRICGLSYEELKRELPALVAGIQEAAMRLQDILSGIRDQTRGLATSGKCFLDLNDFARSTVRLVRPIIERRTDNFSLVFTENLPRVFGSHAELGQVVLTLILNACEALPNRTRYLHVRTSIVHGFIQLEIEDEGKGIPMDWIDRLGREPFINTEGNIGLGLWVAFAIVEHHHGSLRLISRAQGGTLAQLCLPVVDEGAT